MKQICLFGFALLASAGVAHAAERKAPQIGDQLTAVEPYCAKIGGYFKTETKDGVITMTCDAGEFFYHAAGGRYSDMRISARVYLAEMTADMVRVIRGDLRERKSVAGPSKCSRSKDCEVYSAAPSKKKPFYTQWQTVIFDGGKGAVTRQDRLPLDKPTAR